MAEDSNMEQPTSDASTADISHPDTNMTNTYNNHESSGKKKPTKERKERKKSRASLATINVILLDEEEFACSVDVSDILFFFS